MRVLGAFLVGFAIGSAVSFLSTFVLSLPFFFAASLFGAGNLVLALDAGVSLLVGVLFGAVSVVVYSVWRALTRTQQLVIILVLLGLGFFLVQPELDVVAFIGVVLTVAGVSRAPALGRK